LGGQLEPELLPPLPAEPVEASMKLIDPPALLALPPPPTDAPLLVFAAPEPEPD
jgi:hypothetical protein